MDFSARELEHTRVELDEINSDIRTQSKMVKDDRIRPKMIEFERLMKGAERQRLRRVNAIGNKEPRCTPTEDAIQFGSVNASMLAGRGSPQELATGTLSPYASENEESLPLELYSTIRPTRSFEPMSFQPSTSNQTSERPTAVTSSREDLRFELNQRRVAAQCLSAYHKKQSGDVHDHGGPSRNKEQRRNPDRDWDDTTSQMSRASYVSKQEVFTGPVTGRAFPPFARESPVQISRNDPNIIGISEIFIHPPKDAHICAICNGKHRAYRCTTMLRIGLQERWFKALRAGICLNCMIRGHSSFACKSVGACQRCGCRHNSILCPRNPNNL